MSAKKSEPDPVPDTEPEAAAPPVAEIPDLDSIPTAEQAGAVGFGDEGDDATPRYPLEKLEGIPLVIDRASFLPSSYGGDFVIVNYRFADTGKKASTSTGAAAVKDRLQACGQFPFKAQFIQKTSGQGREYWTLE